MKKNFKLQFSNRLAHLQPVKNIEVNDENRPPNQISALTDALNKFTAHIAETVNRLEEKIDSKINYLNKYEQKQSCSHFEGRIEERFQKVDFYIPEIGENDRNQKIEEWLGQFCKIIFSISFKFMEEGVLNEQSTKIFCSQNLIYRIIQFIRKNKLSENEIAHLNEFLKKQILPYLLLKYPQTEAVKANLRLSKQVIPINNFNSNANELVYLSQTKFEYNSNGKYNGEIMRIINFIIKLPNSPINLESQAEDNKSQVSSKRSARKKDVSVYNLFENDMQKLFKSLQIESQMIDMKNGERSSMKNIEEEKDEAKSQKYRQKVKSYTKYLIGRKVPEQIPEFTEQELLQKKLIIKSPHILRIINKLCGSLEEKFYKRDYVIIDREEQFRMMDGSQAYLKKTHRLLLSKLLEKQKKQIQKYLKKVMAHNYEFQKYFANYQVPSSLKGFTDEESMIGLFAASTFKNNQTYIILYLNRLIHGILTATTTFEEFIKIENLKGKKANQFKKNIDLVYEGKMSLQKLIEIKNSFRHKHFKPMSEFVPQLVTFRLGDLLRCKCSSRQAQITALYRQMHSISRRKPQLLKIIRIKNRLETANKDVLINVLYRRKVMVQIQLGFNETKHNFITSSNKFNHYLYQLKRAEFGPISELCSIWMNCDYRAKFYQSKYQKLNKREQPQEFQHLCLAQELSEETLPIICSYCKVIRTNVNCIQKNYNCLKCNKNICGLCFLEINSELIETSLKTNLKGIINEQNFKLQKNLIPNSGAYIDIYVKDIFVKHFIKIDKRKTTYLFEQLPNGEYLLLKTLKNKKEKEEFLKNHAVVGFSKEILKSHAQILLDYFVPKSFEEILNQERTSILQERKNITNDLLKKIKECYMVRKINLSENKISDLALINEKFPNIEIAVLSQNCVSIIPQQISEFHLLRHLDLSLNEIQQVQKISELKTLSFLNLSHNAITSLPETIKNLQNLKTLNIGFNQLKQLPQLPTCLRKIDVQQNKLNESFDISSFKLLKALNLSNNKLVELKGAENLPNLKVLELTENHFKSITLINLPYLQDVNLSYCYLESIEIQNIEAKKSSLKSLNLSYNKLTELQENFFISICKIENLNLNFNKIDKITPYIYHLTNLEELLVRGIKSDKSKFMEGTTIVEKPSEENQKQSEEDIKKEYNKQEEEKTIKTRGDEESKEENTEQDAEEENIKHNDNIQEKANNNQEDKKQQNQAEDKGEVKEEYKGEVKEEYKGEDKEEYKGEDKEEYKEDSKGENKEEESEIQKPKRKTNELRNKTDKSSSSQGNSDNLLSLPSQYVDKSTSKQIISENNMKKEQNRRNSNISIGGQNKNKKRNSVRGLQISRQSIKSNGNRSNKEFEEGNEILPPQMHSFLLNLNIIDLGQNRLKQIPSTIIKMAHLEDLYISQNQIEGINQFLGVITLDISHNKIKQFSEKTASNLPTIRKINLIGNSIQNKKSSDIKKLFNNNVEIEFDSDSSMQNIS